MTSYKLITALHYYRPQRSCGQGNVFTAVCDSVDRRGLWQGEPPLASRPPMQGNPHRQGELPGQGDPLAGRPPWQGDPQQGDPPGQGEPPAGRTPLARRTPPPPPAYVQ